MIPRTPRDYLHGGRERVEVELEVTVMVEMRSCSWRVVLAEGNLLNSHILRPVGIGLQLIDI